MTPNEAPSVEVFVSPTFGKVSLEQAIEKMTSFRVQEPMAAYRLLIGTDSLPGSKGEVVVVTAVVFLREGNGGIYFWRRKRFSSVVTLRQRMYQEALTSIEVAKLILENPVSQQLGFLAGDIEIHVDIGHHGQTRDMIREIVGMVKANGFPVKTKPEAVAASSVADRHTVAS